MFEGLGLSAARIADTAGHLARARAALEKDVEDLLACASRRDGACVLVDPQRLSAAPDEIGLRALARLLMEVSARFVRPRFERLETLFDSLRSGALGRGRTLHGCRIYPASKRKAVFGSGTLCIEPEAERAVSRRPKRGQEDDNGKPSDARN
jgi:tRNA(Ile)-lysidine synthase